MFSRLNGNLTDIWRKKSDLKCQIYWWYSKVASFSLKKHIKRNCCGYGFAEENARLTKIGAKKVRLWGRQTPNNGLFCISSAETVLELFKTITKQVLLNYACRMMFAKWPNGKIWVTLLARTLRNPSLSIPISVQHLKLQSSKKMSTYLIAAS